MYRLFFSLDLKVATDVEGLTLSGKLFHSLGVTIEKGPLTSGFEL